MVWRFSGETSQFQKLKINARAVRVHREVTPVQTGIAAAATEGEIVVVDTIKVARDEEIIINPEAEIVTTKTATAGKIRNILDATGPRYDGPDALRYSSFYILAFQYLISSCRLYLRCLLSSVSSSYPYQFIS